MYEVLTPPPGDLAFSLNLQISQAMYSELYNVATVHATLTSQEWTGYEARPTRAFQCRMIKKNVARLGNMDETIQCRMVEI